MRRSLLLAACLLAAGSLKAAFAPVGGARVEAFDGSTRAWRAVDVTVLYQAEPEAVRLLVPGLNAGGNLYLRQRLESLPGYQRWIDERRREGGSLWEALQALLADVAGKDVVAMTFQPLADGGRAEVVVGLRPGSRFDSYVRVRGLLKSTPQGLEFDPDDVQFDQTRAALAWKLLEPLARRQARKASGQVGQ